MAMSESNDFDPQLDWLGKPVTENATRIRWRQPGHGTGQERPFSR